MVYPKDSTKIDCAKEVDHCYQSQSYDLRYLSFNNKYKLKVRYVEGKYKLKTNPYG